MFKNLLFTSLFLLATDAMAQKYALDPAHTTVGFKVKHLMVSTVSGRFDKFEGTFDFDNGKVSNIDVKIDVDSINTNEKKRDEHLKSPDFFGVRDAKGKLVPANQWMTFKSSGFTAKEGDNTVNGTLTIGKTSKELPLAVNYGGMIVDPWGKKRVGFEATAKINRKEFGVNWNKPLDKGGVVVSDDVTIVITGEAVPK